MGMTIGRILDFMMKKHTQAVLNSSVQKPFAWAVYQTWKWVDANEKPRREVEDGK